MATPDSDKTVDEIVIRLSSSYPRQRLERLIRQLQPRDELAGIVEDAYCTIAPKSLLAQAGLLEAED